MRSVAPKKDNSACRNFVIIAPYLYFYFIFGQYLSNHLEYFNDTLQEYTTGQCKMWHARMTTGLAFIFYLFPQIHIFTSFLASISVTIWNNLIILCSIIQQVCAECCMQEWQLCLPSCTYYLPDPYLCFISGPYRSKHFFLPWSFFFFFFSFQASPKGEIWVEERW